MPHCNGFGTVASRLLCCVVIDLTNEEGYIDFLQFITFPKTEAVTLLDRSVYQ